MLKKVELEITEDKLGEFKELTKLGVTNACTFSNEEWGHMGLKTDSSKKYISLLNSLGIKKDEFLYISAEHNNDVRYVSEASLKFYRHFQSQQFKEAALSYIPLGCDSIITKESIPIVVTPADCNIIVVTGVDNKDGRRFVIVAHSGIFGTILNIVGSAIDLASVNFDFKAKDLNAFVFPGITKENFTKRKGDTLRGHLVEDKDWMDFIETQDETFSIDIQGKIISQLDSAGVANISFTELSTYKEHKLGNLYSYTFAKEQGEPAKNFAVCVCLT